MSQRESTREACTQLSRRGFVKGTALAGAAAMAAGMSAGMFGCAPNGNDAEETRAQGAEDGGASGQTEPMGPLTAFVPEEGQVKWHLCAGCGGCCPMQYHVQDGVITYIEPDTTGGNELADGEMRACQRGRAQRKWINHPDRILHPLKRVEGTKRGEGKYEQISWDEAIDLFYEKLKHVLDTYGNEAVMRVSSVGVNDGAIVPSWWDRLLTLLGGQLGSYGTDSMGQSDAAVGYMWYGSYPGQISYAGSKTPVMADADLIVLFGSSVATSNNRGMGTMVRLLQAAERGARIINVDVRQGEEASGGAVEWLPIRPGTDGALACALCHTMIAEDLADEETLHTHTVGYDEQTMPKSAQGQHKSFKDYIMGTGWDEVEKTAEWAEPITGIPAEQIKQLARDIANAKACYIATGLGVQRRSNGESTQAAIMMVPLVAGQWGLPGTSIGAKPMPGGGPGANEHFDFLPNPIKASIPITKRIEAIERGAEMTALTDGVLGAERLTQNLKFIYAWQTACLANQNMDPNWSGKILGDESKCEFIVGSDFFLTSSMRYCDLILPEVMPQERTTFGGTMNDASMLASVFAEPVQQPMGECRREYDWIVGLAERFDILDEFCEGHDPATLPDDLIREHYEALVASGAMPTLPATYEDAIAQGYWCMKLPEETITPAFSDFRADPEANPLPTPSGKIEVYSEQIADIADSWILDEEQDKIFPIPAFFPGYRGYTSVTEEYPLLGSSFKSKIRYHSKWNEVDLLNQANRHTVWINPIDAEPRGIKSGDMVRVFNDCGELHIEARVTPRVFPGAFTMEEGRMRSLDENGIDVGACVNTLVHHHVSPLAKFNNSNSIIAQIEKL